jgi:phosphomevalonate kinase
LYLHLNEPLETEYRKINNEQSLDYKEMIKYVYCFFFKKNRNIVSFRWGEVKRREDETIFCRMTMEENNQLCLSSPIWIIDDIRYNTDIEFFKAYFNDRLLVVRIETSNDIRQKRGWSFINEIDDSEAECQLDTNVQWSFVFSNNEEDNFNEQMINLMKMINT